MALQLLPVWDRLSTATAALCAIHSLRSEEAARRRIRKLRSLLCMARLTLYPPSFPQPVRFRKLALFWIWLTILRAAPWMVEYTNCSQFRAARTRLLVARYRSLILPPHVLKVT